MKWKTKNLKIKKICCSTMRILAFIVKCRYKPFTILVKKKKEPLDFR